MQTDPDRIAANAGGHADVLVLGATGRVGEALRRLLPGYGLSVRGVPRTGWTGQTDLATWIEAVDPRVIVYAAAIADPDRCEQDPSASYEVNVAGAGWVADAAAKAGRRVIYYSSDYVFGAPGRYFEDAPTAPLQVYGRHKVAAEQLLLSRGDNVVIRLPLLFGSRDFIAEAVAAMLNGTPLSMDDRRRYPIPVEHVVRVTSSVVATKFGIGIYHAVGVDGVTKAAWAGYIAELLDRPVPPALAPAGRPVAPRPVDVELATHHPEMRTQPGTLWAATQARVAELCGAGGGAN